MSKDYVLGELEKLCDDDKYYMKSPKKMREFVERTSDLMNKLKNYELEKDEKKKMLRISDALQKLRKILR